MDDEASLLPRKLQAALEQALEQRNDIISQDSDSESDEGEWTSSLLTKLLINSLDLFSPSRCKTLTSFWANSSQWVTRAQFSVFQKVNCSLTDIAAKQHWNIRDLRKREEKNNLWLFSFRFPINPLSFVLTEYNSLNSLVSGAFIRFFLETIGHYSLFIAQNERGERIFQRETFRKSVASKSIRRFLGVFMESQMFAGFIQDRELRKNRAKGRRCVLRGSLVSMLVDIPITEYTSI